MHQPASNGINVSAPIICTTMYTSTPVPNCLGFPWNDWSLASKFQPHSTCFSMRERSDGRLACSTAKRLSCGWVHCLQVSKENGKIQQKWCCTTGDGRNPKQPHGIYTTLQIMGINYQPQLVQDCFHPQYDGQIHQAVHECVYMIYACLYIWGYVYV